MHARYLNSIAAIIVPGNCPVERVSLCKGACSCAKRGLIIRNLAEIPIGSCVFHSIERARHQLHKEPPPPNLLPGNTGMATGMQPRQVDLVHSFHYIKKKEREREKKTLLNWFPFWKLLNIFSSNYSRWQKLICLREKKRAWQKYVTSPMQQWKALSSLLTSRCLPTQLALSNEVLHMVSMTGETKNNTQMAVWTGERGVHEP